MSAPDIKDPRVALTLEAANSDSADCFICGKSLSKLVELNCTEGLFPRMYLHRGCAGGKHPEVIRNLYLDSVERFTRGA